MELQWHRLALQTQLAGGNRLVQAARLLRGTSGQRVLSQRLGQCQRHPFLEAARLLAGGAHCKRQLRRQARLVRLACLGRAARLCGRHLRPVLQATAATARHQGPKQTARSQRSLRQQSMLGPGSACSFVAAQLAARQVPQVQHRGRSATCSARLLRHCRAHLHPGSGQWGQREREVRFCGFPSRDENVKMWRQSNVPSRVVFSIRV